MIKSENEALRSRVERLEKILILHLRGQEMFEMNPLPKIGEWIGPKKDEQ